MNYVESLNLLGVEARQIPCIKGSGAPDSSTNGDVGCLYMDIETGDVYKCVAIDNGSLVWKITEDVSKIETLERKVQTSICAVSTAEEMDEVLANATESDIGSVYMYIGKTTASYTNGAIYKVGVTV